METYSAGDYFVNREIVPAVQHAVMQALITSTLRILLGTGSIFAFPGSVISALLAGILYKKTKKILPTALAEMVGTGILGALIAYAFLGVIIRSKVIERVEHLK